MLEALTSAGSTTQSGPQTRTGVRCCKASLPGAVGSWQEFAYITGHVVCFMNIRNAAACCSQARECTCKESVGRAEILASDASSTVVTMVVLAP